jgi:hypothetical protein
MHETLCFSCTLFLDYTFLLPKYGMSNIMFYDLKPIKLEGSLPHFFKHFFDSSLKIMQQHSKTPFYRPIRGYICIW